MRYTFLMKNKPQTKRYPYRFSSLILALFVAGLALCAASLILTGFRIYHFLGNEEKTVYEWLQYGILLFMSLLFFVLIVSMLLRSQYEITDEYLVMQFGVIRSKYRIDSIFSVHLFRGANKLAVYFDDFHTNYIVIVVKPEWYDDFVRTLIEKKPSIAFSFSTAEEEEEIKKKK